MMKSVLKSCLLYWLDYPGCRGQAAARRNSGAAACRDFGAVACRNFGAVWQKSLGECCK